MIPKVREAVRVRAGEHCESCGSRGDFRGLQIHHRKKRSQGGLDTEDNLWLLCGVCHDREHGIKDVIA